MVTKKNSRSPWAWIPTLYFAEGLPNVIVTALSVVMYMQLGLTDAEVGLYTGWLALPWVIKPLWSPFIDLLKTKRWWVLTMQALIGAALAGIAFSLPTAFWFQATMCFFFLIAFCSATHDISADGFYMIELDEHTQTKFVGLRNTFYRLAIIFVNGFLVMLAGVLQVLFRNQIRFSWALIFYGLAGIFIGLWLYHSRFMPRPKEDMQTDRTVGEVAHELKNMFRTFFVKFGLGETVCVMLFLLLYRFPEALLNTMTKTFILRPNSQGGLGLSPQEYGFANGTVGLIGLLLGGILGGILVSRDGMKKWLWPLVCAITLPDVVYIYLSYSLNSNLIVVSSCLFVEQLGYGLGFTVLTLYMLFYSQGKFKTSHYSICTGISYLGLMLPGMVSGYLKDMVGYRMFFIIVMACCAITFLVTAFLKIDPNFGKKEKEIKEEIEEEEAKLKSKVLYQIKNNPDIVPMSINKDGFYIKDETFYLLTRNIYKRVNTMLIGPTGSGKTQVVELICKQLGLPCTIYDMGAMHDPISDLLGVHRLEEGKSIFDYAKFTQDVQKPGVIVLDELSRAPATCLNILFPVFDHRRTLPVEIAGSKDIREIPIHPEVCFISTCNIGIEYTGTSTLDKALKNRFFPIEFTYLPADIEARVLMKRCDIEKQDADMITSIAAKLRRMAENAEAATTVSTRETLMIAELIHDGWSTLDALNYVLIPLCDSKESRELVRKLLMSK